MQAVDKVFNNEEHDPWKRKNKDQPPNIDELLAQLGKHISGNSDNSSSGSGMSISLLLILIVFFVFLWFVSGFYIVKPPEKAVVLRFGSYHETQGPGLHWIARGIENKYVVNVNRIENYSYSSEMLTEDENYAKVALTVFYRVKNPEHYLFNVKNPTGSLEDVVHSALRQIVGHTHLEEILTSGKEIARSQVANLVESTLSNYRTGIEVTDVKLQEATVPKNVIAAFDNVITAREDKAAKISQGQRYVKKVVPLAQGKRQRLLQEASAYYKKVVLNADSNVARYLALLPQHSLYPDILEKRLYFETMETVLERLNKVYVNKDSKQIFYVPTIRSGGKTESKEKLGVLEEGDLKKVDSDPDFKTLASLVEGIQN